MLVRIVQFLLGVGLAGGGGFLVWMFRADAGHVFPPGAGGVPIALLAGLFGVTSGLVFLTSALHPRPNRRRLLAEKAARDEVALGEADDYYAQASRAADRDWRSGDISPLAEPEAAPALQAEEPVAVSPPAPVESAPAAAAPASAPPDPAPGAEAPPLRPRALSVPPTQPSAVAEQTPEPAPPATVSGVAEPPQSGPGAQPAEGAAVFPAEATLAPLPRAAEPPPAAAPRVAEAASAPAVSADDPHAAIRIAISAGQLDEADRMLAAARDSATGMDLALLTALAGDHAAMSGRQSHAKWLWRLALRRFGELDAMDAPAARAAADSLRQAG